MKTARRHPDPPLARRAFEELDALVTAAVTLSIGGGTAMPLAHGDSGVSYDVDAFPIGVELLKVSKDLATVDARINELMDKCVPGAEKAADVFDDLREGFGL